MFTLLMNAIESMSIIAIREFIEPITKSEDLIVILIIVITGTCQRLHTPKFGVLRMHLKDTWSVILF